ncbi:DUF1992 domain-containing protein [Microbacterium sp. zg.B48]|uniref:DnaJ family domain-containing protein n=1 Tax=Microbacterium sp. zg.B48 TaxID=2969408 RepID=UPI00214ADAB3|nr:DUF1992 domain-containing protein [Microbacterium sp. zg.B48]MCR2763634.1 DUF1992 domain-containing protein [Microbacterium sp. zg.B48]
MAHDSRDAAMRYRLRREALERGEDRPEDDEPDGESAIMTEAQRAAAVNVVIEQAIRRGDFDDLPGAGKPIPGLGASHDPDWWIKRKIERERLTGLGPPALTLRTEYATLAARLDDLHAESGVREHLADFNHRVIEARRQLLGGPPVVTPTVDIDEWVRDWRDRRDAAARRVAAEAESATRRRAGRRFWRRGRA